MKSFRFLLLAGCVLPGCTNSMDQMPLVFARTQTFGATVAATAPDQGAQITVGYGDRNLAVVPTTTREGVAIRADNTGVDESGKPFANPDALSVLGQFEAATGTNAVGIGTFFSTGLAASKLADGFRDKLSGKHATPTPTPAP